MRRPTLSTSRAFLARRRPALLLSTGAVVIALAGGATGAVLAGGSDGHERSDYGHHAEHRPDLQGRIDPADD